MERFRLPKRTVLVTGAGAGIGAAIARTAAEAGARVAVNDLDPKRAAAVASEIDSNGGVAHSVPGDVADPDEAARVVTDAVSLLGGLNGLVNNAGIVTRGGLVSEPLDEWDRVMRIDYRAALLCSRSAYERLRADGGSIVNIASIAAVSPSAGTGAYTSAKAALVALTQQTALEWGPDGIRANAVAPGMISGTNMSAGETDELRERRGNAMPLRRTGRPDDVADAVVFLLSEAARFITGQMLLVDGGWSVSLLSFTPAPWDRGTTHN